MLHDKLEATKHYFVELGIKDISVSIYKNMRHWLTTTTDNVLEIEPIIPSRNNNDFYALITGIEYSEGELYGKVQLYL